MTDSMNTHHQASLRREACQRLQAAQAHPARALVGLDGFIDAIIHVVDRRADFQTYTRIETIADYAARIGTLAGRSGNIEWVVRETRLGGNGPLMASALGSLGVPLCYTGSVGWPGLDPVFAPLERWGEVIPLAAPGLTDATEFLDGKIFHGKLETLKEVRWARLLERMGGEAGLARRLEGSGLIALTNWTMIPFANEIFEGILRLAGELDGARPIFFFDLADPEKRSVADLAGVLAMLGAAAGRGLHVILGLNHREALQAVRAIGIADPPEDDAPGPLCALASGLAGRAGITEIVIHPRHRAAAARAGCADCAEGPFTPTPRLSTGAGDHFNGGYCFARLLGLEPRLALVVGTAVSGYYVRHAASPTRAQIEQFLLDWAGGRLDEASRAK